MFSAGPVSGGDPLCSKSLKSLESKIYGMSSRQILHSKLVMVQIRPSKGFGAFSGYKRESPVMAGLFFPICFKDSRLGITNLQRGSHCLVMV
jgi:hypothetical protein